MSFQSREQSYVSLLRIMSDFVQLYLAFNFTLTVLSFPEAKAWNILKKRKCGN